MGKLAEKMEKTGFEEMPVFGATGEECTEPKVEIDGFIDVDDGEIALATGGDVKTETKLPLVWFDVGVEARGAATDRARGDERSEFGSEKIDDFVFALGFVVRLKGFEAFDDIVVFEMDTDEVVIVSAAFDGGPFDDVIAGGTGGVAHVGLFENF